MKELEDLIRLKIVRFLSALNISIEEFPEIEKKVLKLGDTAFIFGYSLESQTDSHKRANAEFKEFYKNDIVPLIASFYKSLEKSINIVYRY